MKKFGIAVLAFCAIGFAQENLATWAKYKNITVNTKATGANVATSVTNIPVLVRLDSSNASDIFTQALTGGADLRFGKPNGSARPFEIEYWNAATKQAAIWVLADTVKGNDSSVALRVYWGKAAVTSASNGPAVYDTANGYVGEWHLGNSASISRPASVRGAPAAVVRNGLAPVSGIIGLADTLDGNGAANATIPTGRYIDLGRDSAFNDNNYAGFSNFTTGLTYSLWFQQTAAMTFIRMLALGSDSTNVQAGGNSRILFMGNQNQTNLAGRANVAVRFNGIASFNSDTTVLYTNGNVWNHLTFTKTPGTSAISIYKNGVLLGTTAAGPDAVTLTRNFAWIGRSTASTDGYYSGKVDNVSLSKVARDSNFVKLSYETQKAAATVLGLGTTQSTTVADTVRNVYYVMQGTGNTPRDTIVFQTGVAVNLNLNYTGGPVDSIKLTTGTIPTGLTVDLYTGKITGTPTAVTAAASQTLTVYTSLGNVTRGLRTSVVAGPLSLKKYTQDTATYTVGIPATNAPQLGLGRTATKYSITPALPAGLSIDTVSGVISGTPSAVTAAANFTVKAMNATDTAARNLRFTVVANSEVYTTWGKHRTIYLNTANNSTGAKITGNVRNFPVAVRIAANDSIFRQVLAGAADLRFTKADNATFLPYQIEQWDSARAATVWVLVDTVKANSLTQNIQMHWGKVGSTSLSSGSSVFSVANGFQAVWHMGAGTGNEIDATANGFVAEAFAAPGDSTGGAVGKARKFDGATQYFQVQNSVTGALDFGVDQNYTISAWANPNTIPSNGNGMKLVEKGDDQWTLAVYNAANPKYWEITTKLNNGAATWAQCTSEAAVITAESGVNVWNHVVGLYRGAAVSGTMAESLWVNGVFMATRSETVSSLTTSRTTTRPVNIGVMSTGVGATGLQRYWTGMLDEVRLQNVVRSADWIALEYANQRPVGQNLVSFTAPVSIARNGARTANGLSLNVKSSGLGLSFMLQGANTGDKATLSLVDMWGRTVFNNTFANAQNLVWNGLSNNGQSASAGIYIARVTLVDAKNVTKTLEMRVPFTK